MLAGLGLAPFALAAGPACGGAPGPSVFAASSLTEALADAADRFADGGAARPGLNFAASSVLATQIIEGAPADMFVSADEVQMDRLLAAGEAVTPRVVAMNSPAVVARLAAGVETFFDLSRPGLRVVLAGPSVPIGRYARLVLDGAAADPAFGAEFSDGVLANVRSEELSARAVLAKVQLGEADAGFVFRTDANLAGGATRSVEIPGAFQVSAVYPAAVIRKSSRQNEAAAFLEFLLSPGGQSLLVRRGFGAAAGSG